MSVKVETIEDIYSRDGFVFPINAVSENEAKKIRADLEKAEDETANDPEKLALIRSYPDRLIPSFDQLIRNENLIKAVEPILGPDLLLSLIHI